jgi:hypothetical protein
MEGADAVRRRGRRRRARRHVLVATVVDDVVYDRRPARWEFVTTQSYIERSGEWRYLAGHTALPAS